MSCVVNQLPITKVKEYLEDKGVSVAKRGSGELVASAKMLIDPRQPLISDFKFAADTAQNKALREAVNGVNKALEEGLKLLVKSNIKAVKDVISKIEGSNIPVLFLSDHEYVLDLFTEGDEKVIRVDVNIYDEIKEDRNDLPILYAVSLFTEFCRLSGLEETDSLVKTVEFYENLEEGQVLILKRILSGRSVDAGNIFLRFLEDSAGKSEKEKRRLASWLRSRTLIELPYDAEKVRAALLEEKDLASLRRRVYNIIRETYHEPLDSANAERVADMLHERGVRLVSGRFSRAFYIEALMLANSKVLECKHIRPAIDSLEDTFRSLRFAFETEYLKKKNFGFEMLNGEMQRIINLRAGNIVPEARCEGAIEKLKKSIRDLELSLIHI